MQQQISETVIDKGLEASSGLEGLEVLDLKASRAYIVT